MYRIACFLFIQSQIYVYIPIKFHFFGLFVCFGLHCSFQRHVAYSTHRYGKFIKVLLFSLLIYLLLCLQNVLTNIFMVVCLYAHIVSLWLNPLVIDL